MTGLDARTGEGAGFRRWRAATAPIVALVAALLVSACGLGFDDQPRALKETADSTTTVVPPSVGRLPTVLYYVREGALVPVRPGAPGPDARHRAHGAHPTADRRVGQWAGHVGPGRHRTAGHHTHRRPADRRPLERLRGRRGPLAPAGHRSDGHDRDRTGRRRPTRVPGGRRHHHGELTPAWRHHDRRPVRLREPARHAPERCLGRPPSAHHRRSHPPSDRARSRPAGTDPGQDAKNGRATSS